jgi:plasmid stabilization system protein ParE
LQPPLGQIRLSRRAQADVREAAAYYGAQHPPLEDRFRSALVTVLDAVVGRPESFPIVHRDMRRAMLKVFPYGVFFRLKSDVIRVVGVIHLRRDPKTWQDRAQD